jgi:CheY-like chemotaxis protein
MFRSTSMMPVMTGEEAVRELRKRGCGVFVVGATGNALKGERVGRLETQSGISC